MAKFQNKITKRKSEVVIDFSNELKNYDGNKQKLLSKLGNHFKSEIKSWSKDQISPVDGKGFKALSKNYKNLKKKIAGNGKANLILEDNMLNSIKVTTKPSENKVVLKITDKTEKLKSFNHNKAKSKAAPLPKRRFLPTAKKDKFNDPIMKGAASIISDAKDGSDDN